MDITDRITGSEKLVAKFGYWPTFHDAEVLWAKLDRHPQGEGFGPTFDVLIHAFEMTNEVGPDGHYVLRHHVLVHLLFRDVAELRLEGFNNQNALFGLAMSDIRERQLEHLQFEVRFDSAYGMDSLFQCHAVEVISVTPCSKDGEPIRP